MTKEFVEKFLPPIVTITIIFAFAIYAWYKHLRKDKDKPGNQSQCEECTHPARCMEMGTCYLRNKREENSLHPMHLDYFDSFLGETLTLLFMGVGLCTVRDMYGKLHFFCTDHVRYELRKNILEHNKKATLKTIRA